MFQIKAFGAIEMKHHRHFGNATTTAAREALQIGELIADLNRIVQIINGDIALQEQQERVFDRSLAEYPMLARALAARRDNLVNTIAGLRRRLAVICGSDLEAGDGRRPRGRDADLRVDLADH